MTRAQWRVLKAAKEWHHWLTVGGRGADYHRYCRAFERLKRACNSLRSPDSRNDSNKEKR